MSSYPLPPALAEKSVDKLEVPLVRERVSQAGQLNLDDGPSLDELLRPGDYARRVALSLANVTCIDSRCIGWLLAVDKRFSEAGGKLVVYSLWPLLADALRFLGLDRVLHIAPDEVAARQMLQASEPAGAE